MSEALFTLSPDELHKRGYANQYGLSRKVSYPYHDRSPELKTNF